nr:zinc finger, CCHC-type [Tanacetum cinerariifolium]
MEDKVQEFRVFDSDVHQGNYFVVSKRPIHLETSLFWSSLPLMVLLRSSSIASISIPLSDPNGKIYFNEPVYCELVWELGGETRNMSLLELRWRVGLYSEEESRLDGTRRGFNIGETMRAERGMLSASNTSGQGDDDVKEAANEEAGGSAKIDPFPRREADYPPYGYTGYMLPGYEYRSGSAPDGFE